MIGIIVFHAVLLLLGLGIVSRVVPLDTVSDALGYLHTTIGITTPPSGQVRIIALIWIGSTIVIADGCVLLMLLIAKLLH
jgi:hypothetical protein